MNQTYFEAASSTCKNIVLHIISRKKSNLCKGQSNLEEGAFAFAAIPLAYYKLEAPTNHSLARQQKSVCVIKEGNKSEWINLSNETQLFLLLDS